MPQQRVPAVAIVDTRNVVGQAEEVLGVRRNPTASGIHRALAMYGFDTKKIVAVVATHSSGTMTPSLNRALQLNRSYASSIKASGGVVHEARLSSYRGGMEEKEADVYCARAIAEEVLDIVEGRSAAQTVIVLSQDSDLMPMFPFAHQRGVPIFSAGTSAVHDRPNDWILLTEPAVRTLTGAQADLGGPARDAVAAYAYRAWLTATSWSVVGTIKRKGVARVRVRDSAGVLGTISLTALPAGGVTPGRTYQLFPIGVDLGERYREFPHVELGVVPRSGPAADLAEAVVTGISRPTEIVVQLADGTAHKVPAPLGNFVRGRRVLVVQQKSIQLVGGLEPCPAPAFAIDASTPIVVEVVEVLADRSARARCPDGTLVRMIVHDKPILKVGERRAVVVTDPGAGTLEPRVLAISSPL